MKSGVDTVCNMEMRRECVMRICDGRREENRKRFLRRERGFGQRKRQVKSKAVRGDERRGDMRKKRSGGGKRGDRGNE